jgi:hypothetical protein
MCPEVTCRDRCIGRENPKMRAAAINMPHKIEAVAVTEVEGGWE